MLEQIFYNFCGNKFSVHLYLQYCLVSKHKSKCTVAEELRNNLQLLISEATIEWLDKIIRRFVVYHLIDRFPKIKANTN